MLLNLRDLSGTDAFNILELTTMERLHNEFFRILQTHPDRNHVQCCLTYVIYLELMHSAGSVLELATMERFHNEFFRILQTHPDRNHVQRCLTYVICLELMHSAGSLLELATMERPKTSH
jgi:hypothetical protein